MTSPTLLCVDDEPLVLNSLERLFGDDYMVLRATSAREALDLVRSTPVHVVISDQRMPGMTGVEFLHEVSRQSPGSMRVLLTGYADLDAVRNAVNAGEVFRYLTKPWSNAVLKETVKAGAAAAKQSFQHYGVARSPSALPAPIAARAAATQAPGKHLGTEVLVVDADPETANILERAVGAGVVHRARNFDEAMAVFEARAEIGIVVSDLRASEDGTSDAISALKSARPSMISIICSQLADASLIIRLINEGQIFRFLGKPVAVDRLVDAVRSAAQKHLEIVHSPALAARFKVEQSATVMAHRPRAAQSGAEQAGSKSLVSRIFSIFRTH